MLGNDRLQKSRVRRFKKQLERLNKIGCLRPVVSILWFCFSRVGGWDTELKSTLSCTCTKLQSRPSFSMGPTHGHWQNLWRKGFMACIQVYWGKYKISIGKTKLLTIFSTARTLVSLRSLDENDLVWLVTCQDPMSQLAQFCCGNLMRGEEWAAPKSP